MRCSEARTLTFFLPAHHAQERHIHSLINRRRNDTDGNESKMLQ